MSPNLALKVKTMTFNEKLYQVLDIQRTAKAGQRKWTGQGRDIGRNNICPLCDSGKKYKRCCGRLQGTNAVNG